MMAKKIYAFILIAFLGLAAMGVTGGLPVRAQTPDPVDITAAFTCPNFLAAVREKLAIADDAPVYDTDVLGITALDVSGRGITSLDGIAYFLDLLNLDVRYNYISAITDIDDLFPNVTINHYPQNTPPPPLFTLAVEGSFYAQPGGGAFEEGAEVTIRAGQQTGYTFAGWTVVPEDILPDVVFSDASVTFSMPGVHMTATAGWTPVITPPPPPENILYAFTCPVFLAAVRAMPGIPDSGPIHAVHAAHIANIALDIRNRGVTSLGGIQYLTQLRDLDVRGNAIAGALDFSHNPVLTRLRLDDNHITAVNIAENPLLYIFTVRGNQITELDVSGNPALVRLWVDGNRLTALSLLHNPLLYQFVASDNQITALDFSGNPALADVRAQNNRLATVAATNNPVLTELHLYNNLLTGVNVSGAPALRRLSLQRNQLASINITNNPALVDLFVAENQLAALNVSHNPALVHLRAGDNQLWSLNLLGNPALRDLGVGDNLLSSLDISGNPLLRNLWAGNNNLTELNIAHNPHLAMLDVVWNLMHDTDDITGWQYRENFHFNPQRGTQAEHIFPATVQGSHAPHSGGGQFVPGTWVTIHAGTRTGFTFSGWEVNMGDVALSDETAPTTTFLMPHMPVTITARWTAGTGGNNNQGGSAPAVTNHVVLHDIFSGDAPVRQIAAGTWVTIRAGTRRDDYAFAGWSVHVGNVILTNENAATTTFIMPAENVVISANWEWEPPEWVLAMLAEPEEEAPPDDDMPPPPEFPGGFEYIEETLPLPFVVPSVPPQTPPPQPPAPPAVHFPLSPEPPSWIFGNPG
ncbi:MAG: hypothetical protein FWB88_11050 [Defluviitaleaceae bacterium]|nr:hypothetical protein [Defluviitaleaceae bacterium]